MNGSPRENSEALDARADLADIEQRLLAMGGLVVVNEDEGGKLQITGGIEQRLIH